MQLLSPEQATGFLAAAVLVALAPGPDNLMVLSLGASRGRRLGMAFGLGCAAGCISHTVLAALGVSTLVSTSPLAFRGLKVVGGLYLFWLGWQALRSGGGTGIRGDEGGTESEWNLFCKGLLANAINPKVVMFFLAFLPQFVVVSRGGTAWQILQLGAIFTLQAAVLFALLGYFAGGVGQWLARHAGVGIWLDRIAGGVLAALGLRLLVSR